MHHAMPLCTKLINLNFQYIKQVNRHMKLNKKYSTLLTLIALSLIALLMLYLSISFIQLTFDVTDWWIGSRLAIIIFWGAITVFMGMNLYSEDD